MKVSKRTQANPSNRKRLCYIGFHLPRWRNNTSKKLQLKSGFLSCRFVTWPFLLLVAVEILSIFSESFGVIQQTKLVL